jgi:spore maturation protein CgeB
VKIVIFGLTLSSSWGNGHATPYRAIIRALAAAGHDVSFYEKDVEYYYWRRDFREWPYCRLVLYDQWQNVRADALADARTADVTLVGSYCPEGARISDDLFGLARPLRVFYDLDTPITLWNLARGDLDYLRRDQVPGFDLYLSFTGGAVLRQLERVWGARMARPLYGCVDPDVYHRREAEERFGCDLSYMATYAGDRQPKVEELFLAPAAALPERSFLLAGTMYPPQRWPENVRHIDHVRPTQHPAFYSSCRLTLNVTRALMAASGWCPSGRFFEAAACGAPIVTDEWQGLNEFFDPAHELLVAHTRNDVIRALQLPQQELAAIAERARQRTLEEHTGEVRARQLLAACDDAQHRAVPAVQPAVLQPEAA